MPRFSIIIPTRNRYETLGFSIKTVLEQNFKDFELIIHDNFSTPETKQVVDQFEDSRIRYFRTDESLSMTENWELSVSRAFGEYIILFGDDDGLLPYSLLNLDRIISLTGFKVLCWNRVHYSWPNILPEQFAHHLKIPNTGSDLIINGKLIIEQIARGEQGYTMLPMLYNGAIHKDIISSVKEKTDFLFGSVSPDIYSGFAFAGSVDEYLYLKHPFSINGGSGKSNGTNFFFNKKKNKVNDDFTDLNNKGKIEFHSKVPKVRSIYAAVMDSYYTWHENLQLNNKFVDREVFYERILKDLKQSVHNEDEWEEEKSKVLNVLAINAEEQLKKGLDKKGLLSLNKEESQSPIFGYKTGITDDYITLDASDFGASNVYSVSKLVEKIINTKEMSSINKPLNYDRKLYFKNRVKDTLAMVYNNLTINN